MPVVIWDDQCSFCATSVRIVRALDWRRRFQFAGSSDDRVLARYGIAREEADREMKVVSEDRVSGGFDAVIEILRRLPLTMWFAPVLRFPPLRRLGARGYRYVASRRHCRFDFNQKKNY